MAERSSAAEFNLRYQKKINDSQIHISMPALSKNLLIYLQQEKKSLFHITQENIQVIRLSPMKLLARMTNTGNCQWKYQIVNTKINISPNTHSSIL